MNIEDWPIDRPTPYPKNPRVNDRAVEKVAESIKEFGWRQPIVVDEAGEILVGHTRLKAAPVISRGHYHSQFEPCWYAVRKGATAQWSGSRSESTLWTVASDKFESQHPTQKPVELILRAMRNHEIRTVYDPFLGTGTTLIAAQHEGRRCVGLEIDPRWADVILERWERLTEGKAELA
jgi:hypothetical protein